MLYRAVSAVLVTALLQGSIAAQDQTQSAPQIVANIQQVLHKAQDKDKAVEVTLTRAIDNRKGFSGKVSEISDTGFVLTNRDSGKLQKLAYEDVKRVKQKLSKGAQIGICVAAGAVLAVVIAVAARKPAPAVW